MSTPLTWDNLAEVVYRAINVGGCMSPGLGCDDLDAVRRYTAAARHQWRVEEARRAAESAVESLGDSAITEYYPDDPAWTHRYRLARVLCAIELNGVGGLAGLGAGAGERSIPSTIRGPWAQSLGKGRRHATDGRAWDAALREVAGDVDQTSWDPESQQRLATDVVILAPVAGVEFARAYARLQLCRAVDNLQWEISGGSLPLDAETRTGPDTPDSVQSVRIWAWALDVLRASEGSGEGDGVAPATPDVPDGIPSERE